MKKTIPIDIKEKLVKAANNGENYKLLARQMDINVGTASNMVRRVNKRNGTVQLPKGGCYNKKVDEEMKEAVLNIVERKLPFHLETNQGRTGATIAKQAAYFFNDNFPYMRCNASYAKKITNELNR